jgi:hypothetical protein
VTARLGVGSALRRLAEAGGEVLLHRGDGSAARGVLGRVGADFVELRHASDDDSGDVELVPYAAVTALRPT